MDASIAGSEVNNELLRTNDGNFKSAAYVRKGKSHETCDDSALLLVNERFALLGVFDGLSGEPHAQHASECVLRAMKFFITQHFGKTDENETLLERAIEEANIAIDKGATTASVALVLPNGEYFFVNMGDSHIYTRDKHGKIMRITKDEKHANGSGFTEYINNRYAVGNALGGLIGMIKVSKGRLEKGEMLIAMTDGVLDNFIIEVEGGVVQDASGKADLEILLGDEDEPKEIIETIAKEIIERMQDKERGDSGKLLVPKEDDVGIVVLKY